MSNFSDRAEKFYMEQINNMFQQDEKKAKEKEDLLKKYQKRDDKELFEEVLKPIKNASIKTINEEDEEELGFDFDEVDPDDEPIEDDEEFVDDEETDEIDEADEILSEIDLEDLSNGARLEIIRAIIDSAQNMPEEEEEMTFDDFIVELETVIEEFQYEEEEEDLDDIEGDEMEVEFEDEDDEFDTGDDEEEEFIEESVKPKKTKKSKSKKIYSEEKKITKKTKKSKS